MESILHFFSLSKMKENLTELHIIVRTTGSSSILELIFLVASIRPDWSGVLRNCGGRNVGGEASPGWSRVTWPGG